MKFDIKKIFTPKLLTGLAVVGVIGTALIAVHETKKVQAVEEPEEETKEESDNKSAKEIITKGVNTAWQYKGTIAAGAATITCIVCSHALSAKEIAALTATCGYLAANRDKLETEIRKLPGGEDALKVVKKEMMEKQVEKAADEEPESKKVWRYQCIEDTGKGTLLCLEGWSGRLFRSSLEEVEKAQEKFNSYRDDYSFDIQVSNGDIENYPAAVSMNDLYECYGIESSQLGHEFGYPADDDYYPTRKIKFINTLIALDKLDPVTQARYNEDLLVIEFDEGYLPMQCWQEI